MVKLYKGKVRLVDPVLEISIEPIKAYPFSTHCLELSTDI
jgi:hypothetical protein